MFSAAPSIARWLTRAQRVERPLIVGPDSESAQWAGELAARLEAPCVVLEKVRRGDRDVSLSGELPGDRAHYTPVVIDDIVSTGRTMAAAVTLLKERGFASPWCVGIHAVFSDDAMTLVREAGASRLVTTNTIAHQSNAIDLHDEIAAAWLDQIQSASSR